MTPETGGRRLRWVRACLCFGSSSGRLARRWWWSFAFVLAAAIPWIWFYRHPLLIYASGYPKSYRMEPLQQIPEEDAWSLETLLHGDYFTLNWDGDNDRLYVDGNAALTSSSFAPAGAFIVAALPHGVGFAWGTSSATYGEMNGPWVIPYLVLAGIVPALKAVQWAVREVRSGYWIGRHACRKCGYDLTGNTSGTCPECGSDFADS